MRLISWNVNGLRACLTKGFADYFASCGADAFCLSHLTLPFLFISFRELPFSVQPFREAEQGRSSHGKILLSNPCKVNTFFDKTIHKVNTFRKKAFRTY